MAAGWRPEQVKMVLIAGEVVVAGQGLPFSLIVEELQWGNNSLSFMARETMEH